MIERRRFSRLPFEEQVEFLCKKGTFSGLLRDLGFGGAYILSGEVKPDIHEEIALVFNLKDTEPPIKIFMKGEVVRIENSGFAIRLTSINDQSFEHLKKYIYYNLCSIPTVETEIERFLQEIHPIPRMMKLLNFFSIKSEIMPYLLERAFLYRPQEPFKLSSGKESPYYLDCRKITLYGPTFKLIGTLFWEALKDFRIEGVAGMSIGADPIVCSILASALEDGVKLEGLLIRKEPKRYGTQKQIEGNYYPGMPIGVVEDVITTGQSLLKALEACKKENLKIIKVLGLIDREEGGKENLKKEGYDLYSFFTLSEIISAFHQYSPKN
ncbi:MAG: orotate phosphoribosyltransferase [Caldimicrobium sp.]|nr:orotate phosphoribosyltransferase [Caldimicrobium sp.]MCX7873795.1 orotate phosphoribosyltransferase [Caldimicrobium sp.]MDW8094788.1 orotate phosphoribosyltransferase [Caldimicrobium sp.]